jgi:two-component system sensor histidine kinase HydH
MNLRHAHLAGLLAGLLLGLADYGLLRLSGVHMTAAGFDVTLAVTSLFAATFGGLGYAIGRLVQSRLRAREDARTIADQLAALSTSQRARLHNEKLAAIGRLAAGVAHEIRNPLGVIRACASLLQEGFREGDESHRASRFIREEIDRLDGLIAKLLAFARPAPLQLRPVAIGAVVERALGLASEELRRRRIEVVSDLAAPAAELVADPDLVAQVVFGLVTNAAEAIGEGGRLVLRAAGDGNEAHLDVADSGPGVPLGDEERVFEPFFTTKASGTGLGLAMAAGIAQAHGGVLELVRGAGAGPSGSGACFRLRLPLRRPAQAAS